MLDSQLSVPPSFVALYLPAGKTRPTLPLPQLAERHELCEDMAQMLTEHAQQVLVRLGITEADVLRQILQGLQSEEARLSEAEAGWVVGRLAELLGWPLPAGLALPS